ncbi:hypothetical protein ACFJIW_22095 [Tahibacter sp. UC22_41]|uniref:hypothetical protein n=1 Tax=Tahibacter sp. UC22_41 TaxID=3350178 RepID=UPI0036DBCD8F
MSDRQSATELNDAAVGRALRGLASATPPPDGWATLAASLQAHGLVRAAGDAPPGEMRHDDAAAAPALEAQDVVGAAPMNADAPRTADDASMQTEMLRHAGAAPAHSARRARNSRSATSRRHWLPVGVAAALALIAVALMPTNRMDTPLPVTTSPATVAGTGTPVTTAAAVDDAATGAADLAQLRGESARIEEWLRLLKADETPLDGRSLMAATEIEDMIGLIDLQLAAGSDSTGDTQALWRNRVALLRDLAAVRTTYSLAGTGIAANGTAAAPDNWTPL